MHIIQPEIVIIKKNPVFEVPKTAIIYSDLSPDVSSLKLAINLDSILVSITNLLTTNKGERLNLPEYGANLDDFIFELMDESTKKEILLRIYNEVLAWEPRVVLIFGQCRFEEDPDSHNYIVKLVFSIIGTGEMIFEYSGIITKTKSIAGTMFKNQ